jgi:hypothetical protein
MPDSQQKSTIPAPHARASELARFAVQCLIDIATDERTDGRARVQAVARLLVLATERRTYEMSKTDPNSVGRGAPQVPVPDAPVPPVRITVEVREDIETAAAFDQTIAIMAKALDCVVETRRVPI